MGIERGVILALWALAGLARAGIPCLDAGAVIAHVGAGHLGSAGPFTESVAFRLKRPGRVWAEADGLRGLGSEDRDAAPEVFLDDTYLGPLLADDGEHWRSPQALLLGSGPHWLLVRSAQEGEGPALNWSALRVLGDAPCPPARKPVSRPSLPFPVPRSRTAGTCDQPYQRSDWPRRLGHGSLILSAPAGKLASSGPLVRLRQGDTWKALMKIPKGPQGQVMPLLVSFWAPHPGAARFLVRVDQQSPVQVQVVALGYSPDAWEPLNLTLCGGNLSFRFAQEPALTLACGAGPVEFEIAAQDMELRLSPFTH